MTASGQWCDVTLLAQKRSNVLPQRRVRIVRNGTQAVDAQAQEQGLLTFLRQGQMAIFGMADKFQTIQFFGIPHYTSAVARAVRRAGDLAQRSVFISGQTVIHAIPGCGGALFGRRQGLENRRATHGTPRG